MISNAKQAKQQLLTCFCDSEIDCDSKYYCQSVGPTVISGKQ